MSHLIAAVHYLAGLALLHQSAARAAFVAAIDTAAACIYTAWRLGGDR